MFLLSIKATTHMDIQLPSNNNNLLHFEAIYWMRIVLSNYDIYHC